MKGAALCIRVGISTAELKRVQSGRGRDRDYVSSLIIDQPLMKRSLNRFNLATENKDLPCLYDIQDYSVCSLSLVFSNCHHS